MKLPDVVRSTEPCIGFLSSPASIASKDYERLLKFVTACVTKYLQYTSPTTVNIAVEIAADLIETRPTWKAMDFIMCFKFLRQNAGLVLTENSDPNRVVKEKEVDRDTLKVFGNVVTGQKLTEMISVYEKERAAEMEKYQREKNSPDKHTDRLYNDSSIKSIMGRKADEVAAKQEELRQKGKLKETKVAPDQTYFEKEHGLNP